MLKQLYVNALIFASLAAQGQPFLPIPDSSAFATCP